MVIDKRHLLMYQIQINMMGFYNHSMVFETLIHVIAEISALLTHIIIGMDYDDAVPVFIRDTPPHIA